MENINFIILAFIVGASISFLEIVFGEYKLNHALALKNFKYLFLYCILFGSVSALMTYLVIQNDINIKNFKFSESPYLTAFSFGIATKSISKITLYSFKIEKKSYHVGPKMATDYFEDFFLKKLNDAIDNDLLREVKYVEAKLKKGKWTLKEMDEIIYQILPSNIEKIKMSSYRKEISNHKSAFDKCRYIATAFGLQRLNMLSTNLDSENE
jgi:hypothetical protein